MSANLHHVTPASVDVHAHPCEAWLTFNVGADHVTLFPDGPLRSGTTVRDLHKLARVGDEIARQACHAAHQYRTARRTAELAAAMQAVAS